eukprot:TRINITY_DN3266_c0_g2_i4.p2 TRINITY_DN3266_c0_g2~~TRINITY_DN3266_c0_g2_i4.p2  ORF type:complete len:110 (+),score=34.24 TRINITY_DN3266_c0_g2_i4:20-349(+)
MRYVAAYLLAALGGKANPSADDVKKILSAVGVSVDEARLTKVMDELKDKNIEEVIAAGTEKLASVPSGGGVAAAGGAGGAAAGGAAEKAKEPEPEPEEEDEDMGFDLFD